MIPRDDWKSRDLIEALFISSDAKGEDVYFGGAEESLSGRVLLTGFHGDKIWAKETKSLNPTIVRGDPSGLSLTEYRLWVGFIHLPVPFMGVRQIRDINKISNSMEMKPWDIPGNYSRPICRRIVEAGGVRRNDFGMLKKAASVLFSSRGDNLSLTTRKSLYSWLRLNSAAWSSQKKVPPFTLIKLTENLSIPLKFVRFALNKAGGIMPSSSKVRIQKIIKTLDTIKSDRLLMKYAFPWAIQKTKDKYKTYFKKIESED